MPGGHRLWRAGFDLSHHFLYFGPADRCNGERRTNSSTLYRSEQWTGHRHGNLVARLFRLLVSCATRVCMNAWPKV